MKDHLIIFTGDMVRAIHDGRKTQTRRVIKPQPHPRWNQVRPVLNSEGDLLTFCFEDKDDTDFCGYKKCPYGRPGVRLGVKETFRIRECYPKEHAVAGSYYDNILFYKKLTDREWGLWSKRKNPLTKTSGRFMYKSLIRLWLEVISIRAERVQEISGEDADAEVFGGNYPHVVMPNMFSEEDGYKYTIPECFGRLWDSINAEPKLCKHNPYTNEKEVCYVGYPWEEIRTERILPSAKKEYIVGNPMVWPIEFKRIEL